MLLLWVYLVISLALSFLLIIIYTYQVCVALFGLKPPLRAQDLKPTKTFAIIVPAHNEERVIHETVNNLRSLRYPKDKFDVFVIADNCQDKTAALAKSAGAKVLVRHDTTMVGKGHTLRWAIERIRELGRYDGYIIIDADNIAAHNFLLKMNNELIRGAKVIQGYLGSKNPRDTWVTKTIAATYFLMNRFYELPRHRLGLACPLGGTGFCISSEVLDNYGWGFRSLTEDLEFSSQLVLDGVKVTWCHEAVVYDEKPRGFVAAVKQRARWMRGHTDVMVRYSGKLVKKGLTKGDGASLDMALYLCLPFIMTVWFFVFLIGFFIPGLPVTLKDIGILGGSWALFSAFQFIFFTSWWLVIPLYAIKLEGEDPRDYWYAPFTIMAFSWVMLFLNIQGLLKYNDKSWGHTKHDATLDPAIRLDG